MTCLSSPNTTCGQRAMEGELIEEGLTSPRCLPVIGLPAKKKKKEVEEEEEKKQWANKKDMKKPFGRHDPSPKDSALLNGVATYAVYFLLARSLLRRGPRCGFVFFSFAFLYFFFPSSCFPSNLKPQTQWLLLHQVIQPASHPLVFLCSLSNFCDTWGFFFFFLILMLLLMPHFAVLAAPAAPAAHLLGLLQYSSRFSRCNKSSSRCGRCSSRCKMLVCRQDVHSVLSCHHFFFFSLQLQKTSRIRHGSRL